MLHVSSALVQTSVILAGKCDSCRHSTTSFCENVELKDTIYKVSWVVLFCGWEIAQAHSIKIMYPSKQSFNIPPPHSWAYPGHLKPLPSRRGGNLIIRVFQGVGNLNCPIDFTWNLWHGEQSWGTRCYRIFMEKIVPLRPIGYEERA